MTCATGPRSSDARLREHGRPRAHHRQGPSIETLIKPPIEWAVAELAQRGERESGDHYVALATQDVGLVAVVDGLGHGIEAARAAKAAVRALERAVDRPLVQMIRDCHQQLSTTRGAVISAAVLDFRDETMTWLGVGKIGRAH